MRCYDKEEGEEEEEEEEEKKNKHKRKSTNRQKERRRIIHPASRGGAAHTAGFFGQLKHIYKKSGKNIVFFSVFTMCSVENTVIYAVFGIKSVQNSGFCSVFKALASKKVQCRDLPKPWKTQLFTLFSSIFPCANAAGQLKLIEWASALVPPTPQFGGSGR